MRLANIAMVAAGLAGALIAAAPAAPAADEAHIIRIEVNAAAFQRSDALVDVPLAREALGPTSDVPAPLAADSVDVVEVSRDGTAIDRQPAFQFDPEPPGLGTLTLALKGITRAGATRYFELRCRRAGKTFTPRKVAPLIEVLDDCRHAGQASIRVVTPSAWWFYHKQGAGFASLLDANGKDWIGYAPAGGAAGNFRGIPNLVHPEGYFHPGGTRCTTKLLAVGPLKAAIRSESADGQWACRWDITPAWARLTVLKAPRAYWFLYEGTPGGKLDVDGDWCLRPGGRRTPAAESWTGDLDGPEWVAFGDAGLKRVLFLINHQDDRHVDSYWPMQRSMTVFGFGRDKLAKHLTAAPAQFTVGFCESTDPNTIAATVDAAWRPYVVKTAGP